MKIEEKIRNNKVVEEYLRKSRFRKDFYFSWLSLNYRRFI